jgi:hypothetical protein
MLPREITTHKHSFTEDRRDENDDRTRTHESCVCGAVRYGCLAKRLDSDGYAAWGPVGEWRHRLVEAPSPR